MRTKYSFGAGGFDSSDPPYKPSRAALRDRYGARSIDASAPHSPADTMAGLSPVGVSGGRTDNSTWNSWFAGALPTATPDAASMASIAEQSSLFNPGIPFVPMGDRPKTGADYTASALEGATKWFDKQGLPVPQAAPRHYGDNFSSKFGSGSVSSIGDYRSKLAGKFSFDYEPKLRALGLTDEGDDWPF